MSNYHPYESLLSPYKLNNHLTLSNRIIMAPMTRCKAIKNLVPNPEMAQYYARRADAGLIITEATIISPNAQGYPNTPGIFTPAQIDGWKYITEAVHKAGGKIFLQLWHVGRVSHPMYLNGDQPVAPSPIGMSGRIPYTTLSYEPPKALTLDEIPIYVDLFAKGAMNAIQAEFDGVEIHGANGYLIDQFLHYDTNRRTDSYGSTPENMTRFLLDVLTAVIQGIGNTKTAVRLSPAAFDNDIKPNSEDVEVFTYLLNKLDKLHLAFVHSSITNDNKIINELGNTVSTFVRKHFQGNLIANGSYTPSSAASKIQNNEVDLVAFARLFLANPDLIQKIKNNDAIEHYHPSMLRGEII